MTHQNTVPSSSTAMRRGFTLVELAIVLVIVGLLVGGVLVGRDLVAAATLRHFTDQIAKFDAGANTFRVKYHGMPGDIKTDDAATFGFTARSGARGHGDGNGMVEGCGGAGSNVLGCETALYWRDMWQANLSPAGSVMATDIPVDGTATGFKVDDYLPVVPFRTGTYSFMYTFNGRNVYHIAAIPSVASDGTLTIQGGITPQEAHNIDDKIDDGAPDNGAVRAMSSFTAYDTGGTPGTTVCINNTLPQLAYDVLPTFADAITCQINIRSSM